MSEKRKETQETAAKVQVTVESAQEETKTAQKSPENAKKTSDLTASENLVEVTEGKASILFNSNNVFYNPIQQFNRDISVMAIRAWSELYHKQGKKRKRDQSVPPINILEALAASGLRSIRYAKEIPHVGTVVANDLLPAAVAAIDRNIDHNHVCGSVVSHCGDANAAMYSKIMPFSVVDLDPYGSAAPFLDGAVQSVGSDGLLLVTCTDMAVLAGNGYPEKCYALYGGSNLKSEATHESALRLVLGALASSAARYKRFIEPLLSLSIDYYVRVFVRVRTSPKSVKSLMSCMMTSYICSGCSSVHNQILGRKTQNGEQLHYSYAQGPPVSPRCAFCGAVQHVCGPMWAGPLHDKSFCGKVLEINEAEQESGVYKTCERIKGMVTVALHEIETPFYFSPLRVSSVLKIPCPKISSVTAALGSKGYKASLTHAVHGCVKTDAPYSVIWEVFKNHIRAQGLISEERLAKMNDRTAGYKILTNPDISNDSGVSFEKNEVSGEIDKLRSVKIVRYQENPTKNWGPKARPGS